MNELIFDIKLYIANLSDDAWYKLYLVDDDIRKYTNTEEGANAFIRIAIKEKRKSNVIEYSIFGIGHNIDNLPAFIYSSGSKMWYQFGMPYRNNDNPAWVGNDGTKCWYYNGKLHRENDMPAWITSYEIIEWWYDGINIR